MRYLATIFLLVITASTAALAETTTFKQQILPINCVYEVVDTGTQQLRYVTPDTCPIDPGPPVVTEPASPSSTVIAAPTTNIAVYKHWAYTSPVELRPPQTAEQSSTGDEGAVLSGTEALQDVIRENKDYVVLVGTIITVWWLAVVVKGLLYRYKQE